jgi:hypothetical protein
MGDSRILRRANPDFWALPLRLTVGGVRRELRIVALLGGIPAPGALPTPARQFEVVYRIGNQLLLAFSDQISLSVACGI